MRCRDRWGSAGMEGRDAPGPHPGPGQGEEGWLGLQRVAGPVGGWRNGPVASTCYGGYFQATTRECRYRVPDGGSYLT
jgi:hypothetical protein